MDLSRISARVRPRNPYEAADLGVVMARRWFRPLMLLWLLPSLPLMLALHLLFRDQPLWAALILWWLKPLWESLQLHFVAEALFNPDTRWRDLLRRAPRLWRHRLLPKLLLHRWSLARSFVMPVSELEQLDGAPRARRIAILQRESTSASVWLTLLGNTLEGIIVTALFVLAWMLVPMEMSVDFDMDTLLDSPLLFPTLAWCAYLAMWLVSPFYVCAGFSLYLNRRSWLEAWDIEISFRQLTARLARTGSTVVLVLALALGALISPPPAQATDTGPTLEHSRDQISEILEGDDFNQMQSRRKLHWVDPDTEKNPPPGQGSSRWDGAWQWLDDWLKEWTRQDDSQNTLHWLAELPALVEVLLWGLLIAVLAYLIYRFRDFRLPGRTRQKTTDTAAPTHLFGLELNQASLPDDILASARTLWQQQRQREALSLLYRAALSFLVFERHLALEGSHTEDECVDLCSRQEPSGRAGYFQQLTGHWIRLAYAHQIPADADFTHLCDQWPGFTHLGPAPAGAAP